MTAHAVQPAVVNLSITSGPNQALDEAVANSVASGLTYAVAAGNGDGSGNAVDACGVSPAREPSAITVSATAPDDAKPAWANEGSCVDILAPGESILSTWYTSDTEVQVESGTSMATPHVAGAAVLVLAAHPQYSPQQVAATLLRRATRDVLTDVGTGTPNRLLRVRGDRWYDVNGDGDQESLIYGRTDLEPFYGFGVGAATCAFGTGGQQQPLAEAAGDFDGDGYDDIATGGKYLNGGGVSVLYGDPTCIRFGHSFNQGIGGVPGALEDGDMFGAALAAGDVNGDGYDDLAVGAPGEDIGSTADAGALVVLFGSPSGLTSIGSVLRSQSSAGVPGSSEAGDRFGAALAVGDVTGDGYADIAVGSPGENSNAGAVALLRGSATGLAGAGLVSGGTASTSTVVVTGLGSVLTVADTTGDGLAEVISGAATSTVKGVPSAGAVVSFAGRSAGLSATGRRVLTQASAGVPGSPEQNDRFGFALASGDVTGDDRADLAVGVPFESVGAATECGLVALLPGSASGLTGTGSVNFNQDSAGVSGINETGDHFGYHVSLRSEDAESQPGLDLLVGSPHERLTGDTTLPSGRVVTFTNLGGSVAPTGSASGGPFLHEWGIRLLSW